MSFINNIMNTMRVTSDDDYDIDDDYGFEEEAPSRISSIFGHRSAQREMEDEEEDYGARPRLFGSKTRQSGSATVRRSSMEVTMLKPNDFEDAKQIGDYLMAGMAVVLNMEGMKLDLAQRIIDFTSGATYAMDGKLRKISTYIFIATPHSVELSGAFQGVANAPAATASLDLGSMNIRI